jgi:general stress protein YciG
MAGTKAGGIAAREANLAKDPDFYRKIGVIGAENYKKRQAEGIAKPRGFAADRELAIRAGALGGTVSRRVKK